MGMTMSEKILAKASGNSKVSAGDILWVDIHKAMMDDILGPRLEIAEKLEEHNFKIWDKDRVIVISDHYTPPANATQADIVKFTREWCENNGVDNYYEFEGPCHQLMVEKGHVYPGEVIVGTDSHTCTYGALGSFGTGIGSTEMIGVLATGKTWLRVPQTIKVNWTGKLNAGVMAKDISLKTIGAIGHAGATYKTIEYLGDGIENLIMDERLSIANMAVEAGAKAGLMPFDNVTREYLSAFGPVDDYSWINPAADAVYCDEYNFNASELIPQVSCPHEVDNVANAIDVKNKKINQAYIGSCTGGRYNDFVIAAEILKGRKIAKGIRLLVSPASKAIYDRCLREGLLEILSAAGATILASSCGACLGIHSGAIGAGEVCISSTNRNFLGRMGSKKSEVFLGSPATVAASAITGFITDPREFIK
jgi:3-isopropylmalate/(R)-2-methylmalate dehydratase large subunit